MPDDPNISRRELLRGRFLRGFLERAGDAITNRLPQFEDGIGACPSTPLPFTVGGSTWRGIG